MSKYQKKTKLYSDDDLIIAAHQVIDKVKSEREAVKDAKFSRQTLRNKIEELRGFRVPKIQGRKRSLMPDQEAALTKLIFEMAEAGFAPTPKQVLSIVIEYCEVNEVKNPLYNRNISPSKRKVKDPIWKPTRKWLRSFIRRNKLSRKRTKGMHLGRFRNIKNPFLINNFYELLKSQIEKLGLGNRPECIWNLDESGFPLDPNNVETVSMQGQKVVKVIAGTGRENITVLAACNAAGEALPPLIIYGSKAAVLNSIPPEWAGDDGIALPGTWYGLSKNGWMTTVVFEDWFKQFAEKTKANRPLLLLLDGHISHLSQETRRAAAKESITILKLPSHTTSKLQPLDIAVFGPLKTYWTDQMNSWITSMGIPIKAMSKKQFVNNLTQIWYKGLSEQNIKSGFRAVGIYPFDSSKYDRSIFDPILMERYNKWVELGKPEDMPEESEAEEVAAVVEVLIDDYEQPPPPVDKDGNVRRGKWIWIDEDASTPKSSTPSGRSSVSFLDIVANRLNQPTSAAGNAKRGKRVDMNATIITQEEIGSALQAMAGTSTAEKSEKRKQMKPRKLIESSSEEDDDDISLQDEDDLEDESESENEQAAALDKKPAATASEIVSSLAMIKEKLNHVNFDQEFKGKLFAVHFDHPKKFYIGRINATFCEDVDKEVNQASFHFLDFRADGRYMLKPSTKVEIVPAQNVFYGPIPYQPVKANGFDISSDVCQKIRQMWLAFCDN